MMLPGPENVYKFNLKATGRHHNWNLENPSLDSRTVMPNGHIHLDGFERPYLRMLAVLRKPQGKQCSKMCSEHK